MASARIRSCGIPSASACTSVTCPVDIDRPTRSTSVRTVTGPGSDGDWKYAVNANGSGWAPSSSRSARRAEAPIAMSRPPLMPLPIRH